MPMQILPNSTNDDFRTGAENVCEDGGSAIPVWWREDAQYYFAQQSIYEGTNPPFGVGADMASHDNSLDYTSIYSIIVRGRLGRRS